MPDTSPAHPATPSVVTIGTYDGVHKGHQQLLTQARAIANQHQTKTNTPTRVIALAFFPSPTTVFANRAGQPTTPPLTDWQQRCDLLRKAGADLVIKLDPSDTTQGQSPLLSQTPEEFIDHHVIPHNPIAIVEGPDFRFGHKRAGDLQTLTHLGQSKNYTVHTCNDVHAVLSDHTVVPARSTTLRWLLSEGRVHDAAAVLGRWHELRATIVKGDQRGRQLGYPTANLQTTTFTPRPGVYAAIATLPDNSIHPAAVSVGQPPMFPGAQGRVEAHILGLPTSADHPTNINNKHPNQPPPFATLPDLPEYGWNIKLAFVAWLRDQHLFDSLDQLTQQMQRDCTQTSHLTQPAISAYQNHDNSSTISQKTRPPAQVTSPTTTTGAPA